MPECKYCRAGIEWRREGDKPVPYNLDGTRHNCKSRSFTQKPAGQPQSDIVETTGTWSGFKHGQISLTLKNRTLTGYTQIDPALIKRLTENPIQNGILVQLTSVNRVVTDVRICPDQPGTTTTPTTQQSPQERQAAADKTSDDLQKELDRVRKEAEQKKAAEQDPWKKEFEEYKALLGSVKRDGIPELLAYLEKETDFFIAPSSKNHHDAVDGGLLHHSLKVYHHMRKLREVFAVECPDESLIIIALLHDLCKVNLYFKEKKSLPKRDEKGNLVLNEYGKKEWEEVIAFSIDDKFPLGHGEKSVILAMRHIKLTDIEIMGIRWHMMAYDDLRHSYGGNLAITNASEQFPIVTLIHLADLSASFVELRPPENKEQKENPAGGAA